MDKQCPICGATFVPNGRRKYCSRECKLSADAARNGHRRHGGLFVCDVCGVQFQRLGGGRPPKTCGVICAAENARREQRVWYSEAKTRAELPACLEREYKLTSFRRYYETHRSEQIARSLTFARNHPEWKRAKDSAYYALTRGAAEAERFTLNEIFARDGGVCHLCRKSVDRVDATVDHLVPVALGGPHTRANVALAHRSCNSSKKTSPRGEQLRLLG